jgi:hypothetical protein
LIGKKQFFIEILHFRNDGSKPFDLNPRDAPCAERE